MSGELAAEQIVGYIGPRGRLLEIINALCSQGLQWRRRPAGLDVPATTFDEILSSVLSHTALSKTLSTDHVTYIIYYMQKSSSPRHLLPTRVVDEPKHLIAIVYDIGIHIILDYREIFSKFRRSIESKQIA